MGCCACLAPPFSSCCSHSLRFLCPLYLSLRHLFFLSLRFSPSLSLSLALLPFGHAKGASAVGIRGAQGKGRGQDLSQAALLGGKKRRGTSLSSTPPHSISNSLNLSLYLLYLCDCWCLSEVLWQFTGCQINSCKLTLKLTHANTIKAYLISADTIMEP